MAFNSPSGFSFGTNTNNTNNNSSFSFGSNTNNTSNTTNTGFGSNGSSLFGNNTNNNTTNNSVFGNTNNTSGSLFGNTNTTNNNNTNSTFGNTSSPFGSTNNNTGGSLFGNTNSTNTSNQSSSIFGSNNNNNNTGGSLFGNTNTTNNTNSSGLFGSNNNTGGSLFGNTNTTNNTNSTGLFGSNNNTGGSMFANNTNNTNNTMNQNTPQSNMASVEQAFKQISMQYDPSNPNCAFQYIVYNLVNQPQQVNMPNNVNPQLWAQGITQNPDTSRLVPFVISGFEGLKKRLEEHEKILKSHGEAIEDVENFVLECKRKHQYSTTEKLQQYSRKHKELSHRLLQVIRKLEFIQSRGSSWYPEEEAFQARLEHIQRELNKPTQFKGRLNELTSLVSMLDDTHHTNYQEQLEEESVREVKNCLKKQTESIKQLDKVTKEDLTQIELCQSELRDL